MEKLNKCIKCELCLNFKPVNGIGDKNADIMFIMDSPNYYDVKNGYPLSEGTGELFNKLLTMININRSDVYVTTLVKGKPYGNFLKTKNITACSDYLREEIKTIKPKIIVTMGTQSLKFITKRNEPISYYRNTAILTKQGTLILPTFNIGYILRDARNHGLALESFVNLYKLYIYKVNPNFKQFEYKLHDAVKTILKI